ncbi:hypothetical protein LOC67_05695 [Stieleria sp. JC731]|uniref:hypothetical protein n=1 Tax=Pirellulaceae TaxID=2691357 RepID=UPI001E37EFB7|nr:hypothetical protein [Stieleria sp. JC731]MCC9600047.1 hypothetical protein [Stieleria sp. JC731]
MNTLVKTLCLIPLFALMLFSTGCTTPATFRQSSSIYASVESHATIPMGMRRTKNGWEDASTWHWKTDDTPDSIDGWIEIQNEREPGWFRLSMDRIRSTSPLMIGVLQIASIAAITAIAQTSRKRTSRLPDETCSLDSGNQ